MCVCVVGQGACNLAQNCMGQSLMEWQWLYRPFPKAEKTSQPLCHWEIFCHLTTYNISKQESKFFMSFFPFKYFTESYKPLYYKYILWHITNIYFFLSLTPVTPVFVERTACYLCLLGSTIYLWHFVVQRFV